MVERSKLGKKIKRAREAQGLTQTVCAVQCGMAQSTLANIESGTAPGSIATLRKLAKRLDLDIVVLIRLREQMERSTRRA